MDAIKKVAMENSNLLQTLKTQIAMNMKCDNEESSELEIKVRIAEIDIEFKKLLGSLSVDLESNALTENAISELMIEKRKLEKELEKCRENNSPSACESKLNEISHITQILKNQPIEFDDTLIRQILECVVVQSKEQIRIIFKDGTEVDQLLR